MKEILGAFFPLLVAFECIAAADQGEIDLRLPHGLQPNEVAFVEVQVGALQVGEEVELQTVAGRELGVISPFGGRAAQAGGTYSLPLPAEVFVNGCARVQIFVKQGNGSRRSPTKDEVKLVRLKIASATPRDG